MAIKLNLGTLKEGSQTFVVVTDAKELNIDKELVKDNINLTLNIQKTNNQIDLRIHTEGVLRMECDRCLEIYDMPVSKDNELVFVQKSARDEGVNLNEIDDYLKYYSPYMKSVDITDDVREFILLAIPMRKVPEWKDGKCTWCGKTEDYFNSLFSAKKEEE